MLSARDSMTEITHLIGEADTDWRSYLDNLSEVYSEAYHNHAKVLTKVSKNINKHQQASKMAITFMLSLVTMGTGGSISALAFSSPLASLAGESIDKVMAQVVKDPILADWLNVTLTGLAKGKVKGIEEKWLDSISRPTTAHLLAGLRPAALPPEQYHGRLMQGYYSQKRRVQSFANAMRNYIAPVITPELANVLLEDFQKNSFVSDIPKIHATAIVVNRFRLALWVSWLWTQPLSYWRQASYADNPDIWSLQPVFDDLVALGVPVATIRGEGAKFKYRATARSGFTMYSGNQVEKNRLDMEKAVLWAQSSDAMQKVFDGLPHSRMTDDLMRISMLLPTMRSVLGVLK